MDKIKLDPQILEEYTEIMKENMEIMHALRHSREDENVGRERRERWRAPSGASLATNMEDFDRRRTMDSHSQQMEASTSTMNATVVQQPSNTSSDSPLDLDTNTETNIGELLLQGWFDHLEGKRPSPPKPNQPELLRLIQNNRDLTIILHRPYSSKSRDKSRAGTSVTNTKFLLWSKKGFSLTPSSPLTPNLKTLLTHVSKTTPLLRYKTPRPPSTKPYASLASVENRKMSDIIGALSDTVEVIFIFAKKFDWVHRNLAPTTVFLGGGDLDDSEPVGKKRKEFEVNNNNGAVLDWELSRAYVPPPKPKPETVTGA